MNIPAKVTDEVFLEMIHEQLGRSSAKCGHKCCSVDELLGRMTKEQNNLMCAISRGNRKVSTEVLGKLTDIAVTCIRGARSYQHNNTQQANVHGLDEGYHEQH